MRLRTLATALSVCALALTGCSTGSTDSSEAEAKTEAEAGAFPVTIEHALGKTTIKEEPKRVATLGWNDQDSVVDRYTLTLLEDAPSGQYRLLIGMYDPNTGQRLPATINGQPQPDNAIELTTLTVNH